MIIHAGSVVYALVDITNYDGLKCFTKNNKYIVISVSYQDEHDLLRFSVMGDDGLGEYFNHYELGSTSQFNKFCTETEYRLKKLKSLNI